MVQGVLTECGRICASLQIRQPVTLYSDTVAEGNVKDVFDALLQAAEKPEKSLAIPLTPSLKVSSAGRKICSNYNAIEEVV